MAIKNSMLPSLQLTSSLVREAYDVCRAVVDPSVFSEVSSSSCLSGGFKFEVDGKDVTLDIDLVRDLSFLNERTWPDFVVSMCVLGKAVEKSLITQSKLQVDFSTFPAYPGTELPLFLYSIFSTVFTDSGLPNYIVREVSSGLQVEDQIGNKYGDPIRWNSRCAPSGTSYLAWPATAVFLLRQILLAFSKAEDIQCLRVEEDEIKSFSERVTCEGFPDRNRTCYKPGLSLVAATARSLLEKVFSDSEGRRDAALIQYMDEPFGVHGPGAVAGKEAGSEKWSFVVDCLRLPRLLYSDSYGLLMGTEGSTSSTSRLCVVPKDFRGHRIICAEPKELQWAQQGLRRVIEDVVTRSPLTKHQISFRRQDPSYYMSRFLRHATIDLKDASDTITRRLLRVLFPHDLYRAFMRNRSSNVLLPSGKVLENIETAFTMGNALCFPVETLTFWAIAAAVIITEGGKLLPTERDISLADRLPIRVFGDDMIVPIDWNFIICDFLKAFGLVINTDKSCSLSLVRESCGSWWYAHRDVSIVKFSHASTLDLDAWTSFEDQLALLERSGLYKTAEVLSVLCRTLRPDRRCLLARPCKQKCSTYAQCTSTFREGSDGKYLGRSIVRWNKDLQRREIRLPIREAGPTRTLPGRLGITAYFTGQATRSPYSKSPRLKYGWEAL